MRNLKMIGLLVVMLAATAASSASAANFYSEGEPTTITGSRTKASTLTTTAGTVTCESESYTATMASSQQETLTVTPSYSGCTGFGFSATIALNGCDYVFNAAGTVDIVCPEGKEITVTATSSETTKCIVHIPAQTGLGSVKYKNEGSGSTRDILVTAEVTGIKYTHTAGTGAGACSTGSASNGSLEASVALTGETEGEASTGVWVEPGGTLKKTIIQGGNEVKECNFKNVNEKCQLKFTVTGGGSGWKVDKNEWVGDADPEKRYKKTVGCTVTKVLKDKDTCTDDLESILVKAGTDNEWCVWFESEATGNKYKYFVTLKM
jgi:hypothetical protein